MIAGICPWKAVALTDTRAHSKRKLCTLHATAGASSLQLNRRPLLAEDRYNMLTKSDYFKALMERANQGHAITQYKLGRCYEEGSGVAMDRKNAAQWFRKAAEQGNARAQFKIGLSYHHGNGVAQDFCEAALWYQMAADKGHPGALNNLGSLLNKGLGVPKDQAQGFQRFKQSAKTGNRMARFNLAYCYSRGEGVAKDHAQELTWFRLAIENGVDSDQLNPCSYVGDDFYEDFAQTVAWFRKMAEDGFAVAQRVVGVMANRWHMDARKWNESESGVQFFALIHGNRKFAGEFYSDTDSHDLTQRVLGNTVRPNRANYWHPWGEMITWYQSAADQGDALSQIKLAEALFRIRERDDFMEAISLFRKAAEQGHHEAQLSLGIIYAKGHFRLGDTGDFEIDRAESFSWYRKAAEHGNLEAYIFLGDSYADGESGVEEDLAQAASWYLKAALQGDADAQRKIAYWYAQGIGVELNKVEAYAYWNVALATIENRLDLDWNNAISSLALKGIEELEVEFSKDEITAGRKRMKEIQDKIGRMVTQE